jgi:lysophospholipase L1-like esterase
MTMVLSRVAFRLRNTLLAIAVAGSAVTMSTGGSSASGGAYLALGDSVVFGYITHDVPAYVNPANFVGYPDYAGRALRLDTTNASCPGEASGGFQSPTGNDNGCRTNYRFHGFPLHVAYTGTQLAFATSFLKSHEDTKLVTLGLGANDAFILQKTCNFNPVCIGSGLPALLAAISANVDTILGAIRATGYDGVLMIVNYYSLDYTDASGTGLTTLLNNAITASAKKHHAVVADAFTAFQKAAAGAGGHTCFAGLLNGDPSVTLACDVHPSQSGQQLLARTVEDAFVAAEGGED